MIEVRCFHTLEEAGPHRAEINALNLASTRPDPFSTFEYFENYLRNDERFPGGQGMRLWFLVAFLDDCLIAHLALKQTAHSVFGLRASKLDFFITHDTDRPHLVARPEYLSEASEVFYAYLLGRRREWSFLEFQQQDDTSPLFPPSTTVALKNYKVHQWPCLENGTIRVRWGTLREYSMALSKNFRANVRRQARHLFAAGEVELLASSHPDTTPALFELYRNIEPNSWKSRANVGIGRHPTRVDYFKGLLDAQQPMRVSIQILLLDGIPIAGLICGAFMQGLYALAIVYDDRVNQLAPGSAMLMMGMRQAIAGQYAFFNLLSGFGYYKVRWLAEITETRSAQIYRTGSPSYWHRVLGDGRRRLFPAESQAAAVGFNPSRRDVRECEDKQTKPDGIPKLQTSQVERQHIAMLVAQVRKGQGEFLSSTELAGVMPFDIWRAAQGKELERRLR